MGRASVGWSLVFAALCAGQGCSSLADAHQSVSFVKPPETLAGSAILATPYEAISPVTKVEEPLAPPIPVAETSPTPHRIVRGNPGRRQIALTFDDGPHRDYTRQLVAVLKELGVKATFFVIGRNIRLDPDALVEAKEAGIELANHSYTHRRFTFLTDDQIREEIVATSNEIEAVTSVRPRLMRPPGGDFDARTEKIARDLGVTIALWTTDAGDFTTKRGNPSAEEIARNVMKAACPGGIVILHDPMPATLQALPLIVSGLRAQGYEFVTVSELAADPRAVRSGGPRVKKMDPLVVQTWPDSERYPLVNLGSNPNESPKQGASHPSSPQGTADQGTDQGSQVGEIRQGQDNSAEGKQAGGAESRYQKARR